MRRLAYAVGMVLGLLIPVLPAHAVRTLYLFTWEAYLDPEVAKDFEREFSVRLVQDKYASNEDMLAKLQAGGSGYDVIVPSDYMVSIMIKRGMLLPLDSSKLKNEQHIDPRFMNQPYDPGNKYSVPYMWGVSGIGYNRKLVSKPPTGWADLFDPENLARHKGRISMLNDMREVIGAALIRMGYSANTTDAAQLARAGELLQRQKPFLAKYDSESYEDSLVAGETAIAHGWSGEFFTAMRTSADVGFVIPREGTLLFIDNLAIPVKARDKELALVFVDYLMRPQVAARNSNYLGYPTPNRAARQYLDPRSTGANFELPTGLKLEALRDLGDEGAVYDRLWTELKGQ